MLNNYDTNYNKYLKVLNKNNVSVGQPYLVRCSPVPVQSCPVGRLYWF